MLNAVQVEAFLHQFETLRRVEVRETSEIVHAPWHVTLSGSVMLYGEPHYLESELDLREFGAQPDLMKLVEQLFKTFAAASEKVRLSH